MDGEMPDPQGAYEIFKYIPVNFEAVLGLIPQNGDFAVGCRWIDVQRPAA